MADFNKREQIGIEKGIKLGYGSILKWLDDTCEAGCPPFDDRTVEWSQTPRWVLPKENGITDGSVSEESSGIGCRNLAERLKEAEVVELRSLEEVLKMERWDKEKFERRR
jgi:hypothetical protein